MIHLFRSEDKIKVRQKLGRSQRNLLFGGGDDIFGGQHLNLSWRNGFDRHFLAYSKGKCVGHIGLIQTRISVGTNSLKVCGIGGLITMPDVRGQGFGKRLVDEAVRFSEHNTDAEHVVLFCLDHLISYYTGQQFVLTKADVTLAQPHGPVGAPLNVLYRPIRAGLWPEGPIHIDGLPW